MVGKHHFELQFGIYVHIFIRHGTTIVDGCGVTMQTEIN